jgi:protein-S-isoprenylcysteine O-methyltransferase Ste14
MTAQPPTDGRDAPDVIAFPPFLFAGTMTLGLIAHWIHPVRPFPPIPSRVIGALLAVAGVALAKWGKSRLQAAGTNVDPRQPSTAIVADGPYRFTRNPLYLGAFVIYLGVALLVDALAPLVLFPFLLIVFDRGVIAREERYLEAKFGAPYRAYCKEVRRWF